MVIPCNDLRLAVWLPDDVLIPLKSISEPEKVFLIAVLVILKYACVPSASIFSSNSGIIELWADTIV